MGMRNKILINQPNPNARKLLVNKEIDELRKILDRIEKEIHGQDVTDTVKTLILRSFKMANGNLSACLNYKKISDQYKRR